MGSEMCIRDRFQLQSEEGPCLDCVRTKEPVINNDLSRAGALWPQFAPLAIGVGFHSVHAFPMRLRDQAIGALNLFSVSETRFDPKEVRVVQSLADVATIAILQQRTLEQSHVENSQLETALTSRILIEQVKGVLAERWSTSVDHAFQVFRSYARARRLRLTDLATRIISGDFDTADIPAPEPEQPADDRS